MKNNQTPQSTSPAKTETSRSVSTEREYPHTAYMSLIRHMDKVTQALYIITDLFDNTVPLKSVIRNNALSIGQTLFGLPLLSGATARSQCDYIQHNLEQLLSSFTLLYQYHDVSDMNYEIVIGELKKLHDALGQLHDRQLKAGSNHVKHIHGDFFGELAAVPTVQKRAFPHVQKPGRAMRIQDRYSVGEATFAKPIAPQVKDTISTKQAVRKPAKTVPTKAPVSAKEKRHQNILNILRQKRNASINDICSLFKDCSSKTIQRDLVELIDRNKVVKRGDRRWSTYNIK